MNMNSTLHRTAAAPATPGQAATGQRPRSARSHAAFAPFLLAALVLAGCGDGGGSTGGSSAPLLTIRATATGNGAISPEEIRVRRGNAAQFTLLPATGHATQGVSGCGGELQGDTYIIAKVVEDCTVAASFVQKTYTVTAAAAANGTITPDSIEVAHGSTANFTLTPAANFLVGEVSGCGSGTLANNIYTTPPITAACAVTATFVPSYAIGGSVSGLAAGASLLLGNGTDAVLVSANGTFAFPARLAAGTAYAVQLSAQPAGHECTVSNGTGVVGAADVGNITVKCVTVVAPLYPASGANWNDYVASDGADPFHAGDLPCNSLATGGPSACVHGGERRVYELPAQSSCSGLTAIDALDAFDWTCDTSKGHVRFVSRLKENARVSDLIDFNSAQWKDNQVTVRNGAIELAASEPRKWWSNPLVVDNNGLAGTEAVPGTLYLVSQDTTATYTLGANKTGLVIRKGVTLSGAGTTAITIPETSFLWIEGHINATGLSYGISANAMRFSVLRHVQVANSASRGIYLVGTQNSRLSHLLLGNNQIGINLYTSPHNVIFDLTAVSGSHGIIQEASPNNVLAGVTLANNATYGMSQTSSGYNVLTGLVATGNISSGLYVYTATANTLADIVLTHNAQGINMGNSSGNRFTGRLLVGGNSTNCFVSGGTLPGLVATTCANDGNSDATLATDVSLAQSFAGKVITDDTANGSDSNGYAAWPATPASFDWTHFAASYRAWGRDGGTFPSADNRGRWTSGNGRIWDWSLAIADATLRNALALPDGNDTITHAWSNGSSVTFLRHAIEIDGDGDGLCESGETCLYTPNPGAYQGHGELVSAGTFSSGSITGVHLLQYASNGTGTAATILR